MWSRSAPAARRCSVYRSTLEMIWSKASKLQGGRDAGSQHFHTPDQFLLCCPSCCCRHSLRPLLDVSHCKHPTSSCSWCHRNLQYYQNRTHGDKTQFREVQNHIENTFQRVLLHDYWFHEKLCVVKGNNQFVLKQFLWNTSKLYSCQALLNLGIVHNIFYKSFLQYFAQHCYGQNTSKCGAASKSVGCVGLLRWSETHTSIYSGCSWL